MLHNEKDVILPECGELFCPYEKFKEIYTRHQCDFDRMCALDPAPDQQLEASNTDASILQQLNPNWLWITSLLLAFMIGRLSTSCCATIPKTSTTKISSAATQQVTN